MPYIKLRKPGEKKQPKPPEKKPDDCKPCEKKQEGKPVWQRHWTELL